MRGDHLTHLLAFFGFCECSVREVIAPPSSGRRTCLAGTQQPYSLPRSSVHATSTSCDDQNVAYADLPVRGPSARVRVDMLTLIVSARDNGEVAVAQVNEMADGQVAANFIVSKCRGTFSGEGRINGVVLQFGVCTPTSMLRRPRPAGAARSRERPCPGRIQRHAPLGKAPHSPVLRSGTAGQDSRDRHRPHHQPRQRTPLPPGHAHSDTARIQRKASARLAKAESRPESKSRRLELSGGLPSTPSQHLEFAQVKRRHDEATSLFVILIPIIAGRILRATRALRAAHDPKFRSALPVAYFLTKL
jgi:hypothetical protein